MIIFSSRSNIYAIGGVENSLRNLIAVASRQGRPAIAVCRRSVSGEAIEEGALEHPKNVELFTYEDEYRSNLVRRLLYLGMGGHNLQALYRNLFHKYPAAVVVTRHHAHVLAAHFSGFEKIHYLVPSMTSLQLGAELSGAGLSKKIRIGVHMFIDGLIQRRACKTAKLFAFSDLMRTDLMKVLPKRESMRRVTLVKPGLDRSSFSIATKQEKIELRKKLDLSTESSYFLFVGRFVKAKGLDYFMEAMKDLPDSSKAIFLGDGPCKISIRNRIKELRLEGRVRLVDPTLEVMDYYRACDVFVMSSTYEPLGQTLLEAVACGMRIAAFDPEIGVKTATKELHIDYAVDYATELSSSGLAEAMLTALENVFISTITADREELYEHYSWEKLLQQLV